jgi:hypothetical protein
MNKPEPLKSVAYDWTECNNYLKEKYPEEWDSDEVWSELCDKCAMNNDSASNIWDWYFDLEDANFIGDTWEIENPTKLQRMGQILWEEFGEKDENGITYNEPITFWFSW